MAERNVTFLILAKDFASRVMKNVGDSTDRTAQKLRDLNVLGLGPIATTAAALGPALLPVLGAAVAGTAALSVSLGAAGAAAGVFGAVIVSAFKTVSDASKKSDDLRTKISLLNREISIAPGDKVAALVKSRDKAILEYRARLMELPAPIRAAVVAMDSMKTAWQNFSEVNQPQGLALMARGFTLIAGIIPKLTPLFNAGAVAAGRMLDAVTRWTASGGVDRLVNFLATRAGPALLSFQNILVNLASGFGSLLSPFVAMSAGITGGLENMTAAFATWAATTGQAGVRDLIAYVVANGPAMGATLSQLATALISLGTAAAPLAPLSLALANSLGLIINALPQPVLTALIGSFIAWSVAMRAAMIVTRLGSGVAILAGVIAGSTAAMTGSTLATGANTSAKVANRVVTLLIAGATKAWAAAQWILNAALTANPIGLVIVAVAALAAGIYLLWTRSETFRRIVTTAFTAVGQAVMAMGRWFASAWAVIQQWWTNTIGFFQALPGRVMGAIAALPGMYVRLWLRVMNGAAFVIGFAIGVVVAFFRNLPGRVMGAILRLSSLLVSFWTSVWGRITSVVSAGASRVVSFFRALPGRAASAVSSLASRVGAWFVRTTANAVSLASNMVSRTVAWFRQLPGRAAAAISSLPGRIRGVFAGAGSWLVSAGYNVVMGLVRGIGSAVGAAVSAARSIASSIVSGVRAGMGIGSPSRVMAEQVGRWIPPGVAVGMVSAMPALLRTVSAQMDRVSAAATGSGAYDFAASVRPGRAAVGAGAAAGGSITVVVEGALDPVAVGRQVASILNRWAQSQGKTFELAP